MLQCLLHIPVPLVGTTSTGVLTSRNAQPETSQYRRLLFWYYLLQVACATNLKLIWFGCFDKRHSAEYVGRFSFATNPHLDFFHFVLVFFTQLLHFRLHVVVVGRLALGRRRSCLKSHNQLWSSQAGNTNALIYFDKPRKGVKQVTLTSEACEVWRSSWSTGYWRAAASSSWRCSSRNSVWWCDRVICISSACDCKVRWTGVNQLRTVYYERPSTPVVPQTQAIALYTYHGEGIAPGWETTAQTSVPNLICQCCT